MQKVMCEHCKQEVPVMLYFYDPMISMQEDPLHMCTHYQAIVFGKSICPYCGSEVNKMFSKSITREDIIDLAGGRGQD
jgi:hypothetical protein